ncbi:MAG: helix-turn-helix transcriptional regulator [Prevotella sp.]|nr:helix-turn-helix transcriptional regulator [Prevotella sp.]
MEKSIYNKQYRILIGIIRQERESRQITQEQLASMLSVQQAIISKIETCERRLDLIELRQICTALGISLIDIINKFEERITK